MRSSERRQTASAPYKMPTFQNRTQVADLPITTTTSAMSVPRVRETSEAKHADESFNAPWLWLGNVLVKGDA